jgi:drug/metabolite transporter (DMT)-like permease
LNPNLIALAASLLFGVVVFPWTITLRRLGSAEFFMFAAAAYGIAGVVQYALAPAHSPLTWKLAGLATLTACMYVAALLCCNFAFSNPNVNVPVAVAITAAYPAWTAILSFVFQQKRFSWQEMVFLGMVVIGVVGLGLTSKPAAS